MHPGNVIGSTNPSGAFSFKTIERDHGIRCFYIWQICVDFFLEIGECVCKRSVLGMTPDGAFAP